MIFDSLHSDIMFNRALLWVILAHQVNDTFGILFYSLAFWCMLSALMGVG